MNSQQVYCLNVDDICNAIARTVWDTYGHKFDPSNSIVDFVYNEKGDITEARIYAKNDKLGDAGKSSAYTYEDSRP